MSQKITIIYHDSTEGRKILEIFNREITEDEFYTYVEMMKQKYDRDYAEYDQNVLLVSALNLKIKEMYMKEFTTYKHHDFVDTFKNMPSVIAKLSVLEQELFKKGTPVPPNIHPNDLTYSVHETSNFIL